MKNLIALAFSFIVFTTQVFSQISLQQLSGMGIKSEEDLKKFGVSDAEIENAKREFFTTNSAIDSAKSNNEINDNSELKTIPNNISEIKTPNVLEVKNNEGIYGHSLFKSGSVTIKTNSDRMKAPDSYILGAGDMINITIWGFSEFSADYTIDELGNITPKLIGRISLKGKTFKAAKSIIKSRFSKGYDLKNSQISIDISYSKFISINVAGEISNPGTYSIPSINSAFNVLALAGGPTKTGSVRNIEIKRNGKTIDVLDVYEYMTSPKAKEIYLMDGDFIVVNPKIHEVSVKGEVKRPMSYELKENETLADLIKFAGGFSAFSNKDVINVFSLTNNGVILSTYSEVNSSKILLKDGDEIFVEKLSSIRRNHVSITGAINAPGKYQFNAGETLKNLINKANGTNNTSYTKTGHIYRLNEDLEREIISFNLSEVLNQDAKDIELKDLDEIKIFDKTSLLDSSFVKVTGLVKNPRDIEYVEGITINDVLIMSDGFLASADKKRIEIERVNFEKNDSDTSNYVSVIIVDFTKDPLFKLKPFDIVNFRMLPKFKFQELVNIEGEVMYSGSYSLTGRKVRTVDVIERAGGVTSLAYLEMAYIERKEDSIGKIQLDLQKALKNPNSEYNYILRPGDRLVIPKVNDIVSISGAIGAKFIESDYKINVAYKKRKRAGFYVKNYAGGYDKNASKKSVYAVTVNGQIKKAKFFGLRKPKISKGDQIIVKAKVDNKTKQKNNIDWNAAFESATIKLTAIATLWVLVSRVN